MVSVLQKQYFLGDNLIFELDRSQHDEAEGRKRVKLFKNFLEVYISSISNDCKNHNLISKIFAKSNYLLPFFHRPCRYYIFFCYFVTNRIPDVNAASRFYFYCHIH